MPMKPTARKQKPGEPDQKKSDLPGIRVNRFFTENGIISRREADKAIAAGKVTINGKVAELGDRVMPDDRLTLDGKPIKLKAKTPVIIAYHKPVGVECTSNQEVEDNIIDAVGYSERVFHIGRLDKMSEGLILLTNIGDIVNKILRARFFHEKEYLVQTNAPISDEQIKQLRAGVSLSDGTTRPCQVTRASPNRIRMVLTEGRNRQIRRMIEFLGLRVSKLKRVRIMHIKLGTIPYGEWRIFSKSEVDQLMKELDSQSSKPAMKPGSKVGSGTR